MKSRLFMLLVWMGSTPLIWAQSSQLKVGAGSTTFMDGQRKGKMYLVEYERYITRHISIAPSAQVLLDAERYGDFDRFESATGNLNIFFSPVRTCKRDLKVGYGWTRRYDQYGDRAIELDEADRVRGRNVIVAYERRFDADMRIGIRGQWHNFRDDVKYSTLTLTLGFGL